MNRTFSLLKMEPVEALIQMVNDLESVNIRKEAAILSDITYYGDGRVSFSLDDNQSQNPKNIARSLGKQSYIYKRLNLGEFYGGVLFLSEFTGTFPKDTLELAQWLSNRSTIPFHTGDLIEEEIKDLDTGYILKAHPRSLRWIGQLPIVDKPPIRQLETGTYRIDESFSPRRFNPPNQ